MADTGADSTSINATVLEAIGIERRKEDLQFQLANGQIVTRSVGYAILTVDQSETVDEVVFAETNRVRVVAGLLWAMVRFPAYNRRPPPASYK